MHFKRPGFRNGRKPKCLPLLGHALQLHKMGLLPEARAAYRQLLQLAPNQFMALHMLGVLESDAKNYQQAEILLSRAVAADPRSADAHMSLGVALNGLRRHDEACASYRKALACGPTTP